MDRTETLDRNEILVFLNRIEDATRTAPPGKLALFADALLEQRIRAGEMADALRGCLREWRTPRFPPLAKILEWARPAAQNQPRRDEEPREYDAIADLEKQISVLIPWARHYEDKGDLFKRDEIEREIRKHKDHIDRRLVARGKNAKYSDELVAEIWDGQI